MKRDVTKKGSIIVYTLIILSLLLVLATTLLTVSNAQTRSAIATDESIVAFPLAESGAEEMLDKIYSGTYNASSFGSLGSCTNGIFTKTLSTGTWTVTFFDRTGAQLTSCSSTSWRAEVDRMKADGNHSATIRSIQVGVNPL
jgi:hypothetical protein